MIIDMGEGKSSFVFLQENMNYCHDEKGMFCEGGGSGSGAGGSYTPMRGATGSTGTFPAHSQSMPLSSEGAGTLSLKDAMQKVVDKEGGPHSLYDLKSQDGKENTERRVLQTMPTIRLTGNDIVVKSPNSVHPIIQTLKSEGYKYKGSGDWKKSITSVEQAHSEISKLGSSVVDADGDVRDFIKQTK